MIVRLMAIPDCSGNHLRLRSNLCKQRGRPIHKDLCLAVLSHRSLLYLSAQHMHHQLRAIAQTENRDPKLKQFLCISRRSLLITTVRSPGQDDPLRVLFLNLLNTRLVGIYFTVNITFSDAPCNQLIVLTAKVNDDYLFLIHEPFSSCSLLERHTCILPQKTPPISLIISYAVLVYKAFFFYWIRVSKVELTDCGWQNAQMIFFFVQDSEAKNF